MAQSDGWIVSRLDWLRAAARRRVRRSSYQVVRWQWARTPATLCRHFSRRSASTLRAAYRVAYLGSRGVQTSTATRRIGRAESKQWISFSLRAQCETRTDGATFAPTSYASQDRAVGCANSHAHIWPVAEWQLYPREEDGRSAGADLPVEDRLSGTNSCTKIL